MARPLLLTALALGAAAATTPALAQTSPPGGGDRYGPAASGVPANALYGEATAAVATPALRTRLLSWPGKIDNPTAASPQGAPSTAAPAYAWRDDARPAAYVPRRLAAQADPRPAPAQASFALSTTPARRTFPPPRVASAQTMTPPALAGAPTDGWRPVFARAAASPSASQTAAQATPTSIYAAPPNRALAADRRYGYDPTQDHSVRYYSVARPFGLKPDPAPIPPQFFTATADLGADPPGPLEVNHTTAAARAAVVGGDGGGQ